MVTINNLTPKTDGTLIEYTINYEGTNHNLTGSFVSTKEEIDDAFKGTEDGNVFKGVKRLVLQRLKDESTNALDK